MKIIFEVSSFLCTLFETLFQFPLILILKTRDLKVSSPKISISVIESFVEKMFLDTNRIRLENPEIEERLKGIG